MLMGLVVMHLLRTGVALEKKCANAPRVGNDIELCCGRTNSKCCT